MIYEEPHMIHAASFELRPDPHDGLVDLDSAAAALRAAFESIDREALIEKAARNANPAYDAATHDETRATWKREAERYLVTAGIIPEEK